MSLLLGSAAGILSWNSDWAGQTAQPFPVAALRLWGAGTDRRPRTSCSGDGLSPLETPSPPPGTVRVGRNSPLPRVTPGASLQQQLSGGPVLRERSPKARRNVPDKPQRPRQSGQGLVYSPHGVWVWVPPAGLLAEVRGCPRGRPGALSHGARRPGVLPAAGAVMRPGCGGPALGSGWARAAS